MWIVKSSDDQAVTMLRLTSALFPEYWRGPHLARTFPGPWQRIYQIFFHPSSYILSSGRRVTGQLDTAPRLKINKTRDQKSRWRLKSGRKARDSCWLGRVPRTCSGCWAAATMCNPICFCAPNGLYFSTYPPRANLVIATGAKTTMAGTSSYQYLGTPRVKSKERRNKNTGKGEQKRQKYSYSAMATQLMLWHPWPSQAFGRSVTTAK